MPDSIRIKLRKFIGRCIFNNATRISPWLNTQLRYFQVNRRFANLKNPQTFTEKLSWLKLYCYNNDALVIKCADKLRVREYVSECGFKNILNQVIAIYSKPEDICWDKLPQSFVLKWNFGSGYNIVCENRNITDRSDIHKTLKKWQKNRYHLRYAELQYKNVQEKCIICEKYLETSRKEELLDYKFYCFNGKVKAVLVIAEYDMDNRSAVFMSTDWEVLSDKVHSKYTGSIFPQKPECLEEMIAIAEKLSEPFPFVRVDFYYHQKRIVFGEMTFTPAGGLWTSETTVDGKTMGQLLKIDQYIEQRKK